MTETTSPAETAHTFDVIWEADTRTTDRLRTETIVRQASIGNHPEFTVHTDEVGYPHGGDQTAPAPLAYFATGLTTCLTTQVRAFAKKLHIDVRAIRIKARCHWRADAIGREPYVGSPVSFHLDVDIDSDAGEADLRRLLETAKKGCFFEQTLNRTNEVTHRLKVGEEWLEA